MNQMQKKHFLTCHAVLYQGITDEDIFFEWITHIKCIEHFDGVGLDLYLYLKSDTLSSHDLYELLGFFKRYNIDMQQLRPFLTEENKKPFLKPKKAFWYKALFGDLAEVKRRTRP